MTFDITKHKWSDSDILGAFVTEKGSISLRIDAAIRIPPIIQERDAIAIAKHFGLLPDNGKLVINDEDKLKHYLFGETIHQSETIYINHNFGNSIIGEIKQSEIIGENHD